MSGPARISRRSLLKMGMAAPFMAQVANQAAQAAAPSPEKPNILLLMADQFRADCIGADGNPVIQTPNLDRIAREGIRFTTAFSSVPSCTPARSGLLTGLSPWHHGMLGYGRIAEHYASEMPQALRDAGYYTLGIGKMHWHPQRTLHGFHATILDESSREESVDFRSDYRSWFASEAPTLEFTATGIGWNDYRAKPYVLPERLHPTQWTCETATRFIDGYDRQEPFFLKVSFARPHSPYDPPERFWKLYEGADLPKASVGEWAGKYAPRSDDSFNIWHGDLGPEQVRSSRQGYYGSVSFVDEAIGRILQALERRGWLDNTLIVFTADHGDMTGDHHLWRKTYAYQPSARIPMLMRWPSGLIETPRGQVSALPVELRDVLPAFLDAAGATSKTPLDGRSLLDIARGKADGWRPWIDLEHATCYAPENYWNALTDGRWKYIYHAHDGSEQLFHLEEDPHECTDLAGDAGHQQVLREWRDRLTEHFQERGEPFVKNGALCTRPEPVLYSPNYPGPVKA